MQFLIRKFGTEEFGNAIVDWTVLAAGMILLAIAVIMTLADGTETVTENMNVPVSVTDRSPG